MNLQQLLDLTFGIAHTQASNAAFLISFCVVLTPFTEWWLLHRRPAISIFLMSFVALLGIGLITGGIHWTMNLGDILIIFAAIARALMVTLTQLRTRHTPINALNLTAVQSGVVAVGCFFLALISSDGHIPHIPRQTSFWLNTCYLVMFCTIFAFFVQNFAVKTVGATRTALLMGSEPLFGALFASIYLSETISTRVWLGGFLIIGSSLWVSIYRPKKE